ncbi:hypothetical protein [Sphingopyxis sp.]|uniref:hypothetical protein n=1 Tax=Sphingopyxis sp. TaxID=1908224 RepID=UPI003D124432
MRREYSRPPSGVAETSKRKVTKLTDKFPGSDTHFDASNAMRSLADTVVGHTGDKRSVVHATLSASGFSVLDSSQVLISVASGSPE